ncbi:MAG: MFS transporter [Verrucomicrobiota bacterium]
MLRIKLQFALTYMVLGGIAPLLAVFLKGEKGFSNAEVGQLFSLASLGLILSPAVVTLLADTRFDSRRILGFSLFASAALFSTLQFTGPIWSTTLLYTIYSIVYMPVIPLLDGYYFSVRHERLEAGGSMPPYHQIRLWGTVGFVIPSLVFLVLLADFSMGKLFVPACVAFSLTGAISAFFLPPPPASAIAGNGKTKSRIPTTAAIRELFSPKGRLFCTALAIVAFALPVYYAFFPVYLEENLKVEKRYIAIIGAIGPVIEVFWIMALGWLRSKIRLKGIMILGLATMALRLLLLGTMESVTLAILVQVLHGAEILATIIVPVMYIDRLAGDRFRNSIQGVFLMLVIGVPRLIGGWVAGFLAETRGVLDTFFYGSALAFLALLLITLFFKPVPSQENLH